MAKWEELPMSDRAKYMKLAVQNGYRDIRSIREAYNIYAEGGVYDREENEPNPVNTSFFQKLIENISANMMALGRGSVGRLNWEDYSKYNDDRHGVNVAERSYFMPRKMQRTSFLNAGYIDGKKGDYGLVTKAVNGRDIPIYQRKPDDALRDGMIPIGNIMTQWYGDEDAELIHAGSYPTAIYINPEDNGIYQKAWDLNDYGDNVGTGKGAGSEYKGMDRLMANFADAIGSPVVVTSGMSKVGNLQDYLNRMATLKNKYRPLTITNRLKGEAVILPMIESFLKERGLTVEKYMKSLPMTSLSGDIMLDLDGNPVMYEIPEAIITLPEVTITGNKKYSNKNKKRK